MPAEIVTPEFLQRVAPRHARPDCDDKNKKNGGGGWSGETPTYPGHAVIKYPGCMRCYLLRNMGEKRALLDFKVVEKYILVYKGNAS